MVNPNNIKGKVFYKPNERAERTGNSELDRALQELKYNSMPNFVRAFNEGVTF